MKQKDKNQVIVLAEKPVGMATLNTFQLREIDMPEIKEGEVLLKSLYVSVDPGMRGFMNEGANDYTGQKFQINEPITSRTVARVIESQSKKFSVGDIVNGRLAWKRYQSMEDDKLEWVDPQVLPISTAVSILGVPGLAAYFGLEKIGQIQKGETVVVSGAAGAVGSVAVQIAKIKGCRVVGIAGSDKKIEYIEKELGVDRGINYKKTNDIAIDLAKACPNGIDVFFDNVGGELLDAVLSLINKKARMVICGQIAVYNDTEPSKGPRPEHTLIKKSARIEGFVVFDFKNEFEEAKLKMTQWYIGGKLKYKENLIEGFENLPSAFIGLFTGENIGKQMVKI